MIRTCGSGQAQLQERSLSGPTDPLLPRVFPSLSRTHILKDAELTPQMWISVMAFFAQRRLFVTLRKTQSPDAA